MTLSDGAKLGRYEIRSLIGVGGMGEVYRAADPKIGRDVAIKVLPADFATDTERVARFEQEAQAAGALNHPNILAIYDIDIQDGNLYVVSELLAGEELRQRLGDGPIPVRKVAEYARQIISGLAAAHEKGIVHRDLKPENLFITNDDRVKILDFGLAKLSEPNQAAALGHSGNEDATRRALTNPGVVMGTVGYMSPEQVRGHGVDHRSDIFSFGVVLYEMLTGTRAFQGDSVVETMNAILKEDVPEFDASERRVPPSFERIMRRCLEKKPEHRFHSSHDLAFALEALSGSTSSSGSDLAATSGPNAESRSHTAWRTLIPWAAAALLLLVTIVLSALYLRRSDPPETAMRFTITAPEKTDFAEGSAISPDGQQIAFTGINSTGETSLWVRPLSSVDARELAGTEGASFPFWSPDSRSIAFYSIGKLRKIDAAGGPVQALAEASGDPRGGIWASDDTIVFSPTTLSPLLRVAAAGGQPEPLTTLDPGKGHSSHRWPSLMPDGRHFVFFGRGSMPEHQGLYIASIDSPEPKFIVQTTVAGSYAEIDGIGYLLYLRDSTLMAQRFDVAKAALSGEAVTLVPGLSIYPGEAGPTGYAAFSVAGGRLLYRSGNSQVTSLEWFDRSGKSLGVITGPGDHYEPTLSSDGKKVLFGRGGASGGTNTGGASNIYLMDVERGSLTRLTFNTSNDSAAVFSPDESKFIYSSITAQETSFYLKASNGSGADELIIKGVGFAFPDSWSPDGKYLLYEKNAGAKTKFDLWVLPMFGDRTPFQYLETDFVDAHGQFSPDGRWVAYGSDESGRAEVYIQSFPIGSGKWQISTSGGDQPQWRRDGKELFYIGADRVLMSVPIAGGASVSPGRPEALFQTNTPITGLTDARNTFTPAADGNRFLMTSVVNPEAPPPLTVVLNWAADLNK